MATKWPFKAEYMSKINGQGESVRISRTPKTVDNTTVTVASPEHFPRKGYVKVPLKPGDKIADVLLRAGVMMYGDGKQIT